MADLKFYYGVDLIDVIEGRGPHPVVVLSYVQRLPDTSLTSALIAGGREYFGWGVDRAIAADTYDALNVNTRATGNWKKPPEFPTWPRPSDKKRTTRTEETAKPRTSVANLYKQFSRR